MDMLEWIKPVIDTRSEQIVNESLEGELGIHYTELVNLLKNSPHITPDEMFEIDNLFLLHTKNLAERAYRSGISDAIKYLK